MKNLLKYFVIYIFVSGLYIQTVSAQCTNPPNGVDCLCSTAQLLCTPDLLDGFSFSMSNSTNYGGFGFMGDLCPGLPDDGVPNNVNWFSFIAWCTDLEMDIAISNCSQGGFSSYGVQIALFAGCPPSSPLECITDGNSVCGNSPTNYPTSQTFIVSGLTIGNVYYFMLDGCAGSACDVSIDVIGTCGTGMIDPWSTGITGPLTTCVGNTDTYITEDLNGAVEFYYYLDGSPLINGTELTTITNTWTTAGTYTLCVDVANLPCIPESDSPSPYCIDIMVCEQADAGILTANPQINCPGGTTNFSVTGYTNTPDHDQYLILTDPSGVILEIFTATSGSYSYDACADFLVYSYNVKVGSPAPTLGTNFPIDYPCSDNCCDFEVITISFEDNQAPVFMTPPGDVTVDCIDDVGALGVLDWADNCMGMGQVMAIETGMIDGCTGGSVTREWMITDSCGNNATHVQKITVTAPSIPTLINPPPSETISCDLIPTSAPDLNYTNNEMGACLLEGVIPAVITGTADLCGGTITNTWNDTDLCGNVINHVQTIMVDPVPPATFMNPPGDLTIDCNAIQSSYPDLDYSNGETGACEISGTASISTVENYDLCGGTITNSWNFTDPCGRLVNSSQVITVNQVPIASFIGVLPPTSITVDCDMIPTSQVNLDYTNNETGTCEISGTVIPIESNNSDACGGNIIYDWTFVDACGRQISHTQTVTVNPAPAPTFINPPTDITVDCDNVPSVSSNLDYSNGASLSCEISGSVMGTLTPFDVCTGEIIEMWEFTDLCGNNIMHQRVITIDPIDPILFNAPPADITVSCDQVPMSLPSLNYSNNASGVCLIEGTAPPLTSGSYDACGGTLIITWSADDGCGNILTINQSITVTEAPAPAFTNPPTDLTISCNQVPSPVALNYTNGLTGNCSIQGSVSPTQTGSYNSCGGMITFEWTFTDDCGRMISESQNVTVDPAPEASFTSLPPNITVSCVDASMLITGLNYTNNLMNPCLISGTSVSVNSGSYDECGGQITQTWTFTDPCSRQKTYQRIVNVLPAPEAMFINPPVDVTLACGVDYSPPTNLNYSNGVAGPCEISGTSVPTSSNVGIVYTHTWEFIDPCTNEPFVHVQQVTLSPFPEITIDPIQVNICQGDSYDLSLIDVVDQNNTNITTEYFLGNPIVSNNQIFNTLVNPSNSQLYTILATNEFGCTDEAIFSIIIDLPYFAGLDGTTSICDNVTINLFDFLGPLYDLNGIWIDADATGINLDDPTSVTFTNLPPGPYEFIYQVSSANTCPSDEAIVTVIFNQLPEIIIDSVECTNSNSNYSVYLQSNGFSILPNFGDVIDLGNGLIEIANIPIDNTVTINFFDPVNFCADFVIVTPPNCDCPAVPLPMVENITICVSDLPGILTATPVAGTVINWYENISDNVPIVAQMNTLISGEMNPGTYTYYVESESIEFPGCVSSIRIPVQLVIVQSPLLSTPSNTEFCLTSGEQIDINLLDFNTVVNTNPNNTFKYYETFENATLDQNDISSISISSTTSIFVKVTNVAGCNSILEFQITIYENPSLVSSIQDESCKNQADGSISYTITPFSNDYIVSIGGMPYGNVITDLSSGQYIAIITNTVTQCSVSDTFQINQGLEIIEEVLSFTCNNNGTDTDSSDDYYELNFNFSANGGVGGMYSLFVDNVLQGSFNYSVNNTINIATSTTQVEIKIVDESLNCEFIKLIGPLNPCSTNCLISIDNLVQVCENNGTNSDPSDDVITFQWTATSINGSAANTYNVWIDNIPTYSFMYGELASFSLNAAGSTPSIVLIDSEDNQCTLILDIEPLNSCSSECVLSISEFTIDCSDGGTMDDIDDDYYTVNLEVVFTNATASQVLVTYGMGATDTYPIDNIVFDLPADSEEIWVYVQHPDSLSCIDSIKLGPLLPCSSSCSIKINDFQDICSDNGTPFDPTDDFYNLSWFAQSLEGSADSLYAYYLDDVFISLLSYSTLVNQTVPADGNEHTIKLIDNANEFCLKTVQIGPLESCSDSCQINVNIINIICDNAGTNNVDSDDFYMVSIEVAGVNTSTCYTIDGEGTMYNFDEIYELGPYIIQDGDVSITINDCENELCPSTLTFSAPATCSVCNQEIEAGIDGTIDCENLIFPLIGISSNAGQYTWTGPSGIISTDSLGEAKQEGWYYFEAIYSDGCRFVDSLFVDALVEIPAAFAGEDQVLTCNKTFATLIGTYQSNSMNISFEWRDENDIVISTEETVVVSSSGNYSFTIIDNETGCISSPDIVFVGLDIEEPSAIIYADPGNVFNCIIETINLSYEEELNVIYQWTTVGGETTVTSEFIIDSTGIYILTATDTITGCFARDTIEISELEEYPAISIAPTTDITCINQNIILDASNTVPFASSMFAWYDSNDNLIGNESQVEVSTSGLFYVVVNDTVTGCINQDTVIVQSNFEYPDISISDDLYLPCSLENGTLSVEALQTNVSIFWTTMNGEIVSDNTLEEIDISGSGEYIVSVIDNLTGCEVLDTVNVFEIDSKLVINQLLAVDETCLGEADGMIMWQNITGGSEPYEITINSQNANSNEQFNLSPGEYFIEIVDVNGCEFDTLLQINAGQSFTANTNPVIQLESGEDGLITVITSIPENEIASIIWTPSTFLSCDDCLSAIANPPSDISYTILVTDLNGCTAETTVNIIVRQSINIYVPNTFSPNEDGINDSFTIYSQDIEKINVLSVYNRWGELVFTNQDMIPNDPSLGWDGTYKGRRLNPGVFVFYAELLLSDGRVEVINGDITIVK